MNYKIICLLFIIVFCVIIGFVNKENMANNNNNKKIAICMWYDDAIKEYGDIAKQINQKYCNINGYDLIFSNKRNLKDRHPAWERLPLLLNTLMTNKYDYVMWIDADACFNLNCKKFNLNKIINDNKDKDIILSADMPGAVDNGTGGIVNSGVMILKNTKFSINFIKNVIISDSEKCKNHFNNSNWDQECIIDTYNKYNKDKIIILPFNTIQTFPYNDNVYNSKALIYHYAGIDKFNRIKKLTEHFNEFK